MLVKELSYQRIYLEVIVMYNADLWMQWRWWLDMDGPIYTVVKICCLWPGRGRGRGKEGGSDEIKLVLALGTLNRVFHSIEELK